MRTTNRKVMLGGNVRGKVPWRKEVWWDAALFVRIVGLHKLRDSFGSRLLNPHTVMTINQYLQCLSSKFKVCTYSSDPTVNAHHTHLLLCMQKPGGLEHTVIMATKTAVAYLMLLDNLYPTSAPPTYIGNRQYAICKVDMIPVESLEECLGNQPRHEVRRRELWPYAVRHPFPPCRCCLPSGPTEPGSLHGHELDPSRRSCLLKVRICLTFIFLVQREILQIWRDLS